MSRKIERKPVDLDKAFEMVRDVSSESDGASPLIIVAWLEDALHHAILESFVYKNSKTEGNLMRLPFEQLIELAFNLGLICENDHSDLGHIRRIRNRFAHFRKRPTFDDADIQSECRNLNNATEINRSATNSDHFNARKVFEFSSFRILLGILGLHFED